MTITHKEIIEIHPVSVADRAALPLVSDIQFAEPFTSNALNLKHHGIVRPGVFRGFDYSIGDGLKITIGDDSGKNTAYIERDDYSLTIHQQHAVTLELEAGKLSIIAIEGFYEYGTLTKQVDVNATAEGARLVVLSEEELEEHHQIVCEVDIPTGAEEINEEMVSVLRRIDGGYDLDSHVRNPHPHVQYFLRDGSESVTGDLHVEKSVRVDGDAGIDGNLSVAGDLSVDGHSSTTGDQSVGGKLGVDRDIEAGSNLSVAGDLSVDGHSSTTGDQSVGGGLGVVGDIE
uniref:polymer-forming cytoskeletal protein n=1 Tax=Thaumasiovibrio sp. DFM-14 TaxID=3384792 RepID=UPI0039A1E69E